MSSDALFCTLASADIAQLIRTANISVCYAGPGIQMEVAKEMLGVIPRLGPDMLTVCVDFDERIMRMGYGSIEAVKILLDANIVVSSAPGLRTALVIVDDTGFIFTPTPLYLEAEPVGLKAPNAVRMSKEQIAEALARLSPAAKAIAIAHAKSPVEKERVKNLSVDVRSDQVVEENYKKVASRLNEVPPVRFDLARQVRVFEPYLQYVELCLTGAAIQRHRMGIPTSIQKLGGSKDLEGRLRTTFDLIERGGKLSSKPLEDALNEIRKNLTPSLGKDHGRVVLKSLKPRLIERLNDFRKLLKSHQTAVTAELQSHLDESRKQIIDFYLSRVIDNPPDVLCYQPAGTKPDEDLARRWLDNELNTVFPRAESLIEKMKLEERYKDVTFETLNQKDFLETVKKAFPLVDWDKTYEEFKAAGESES